VRWKISSMIGLAFSIDDKLSRLSKLYLPSDAAPAKT
jgi:hypothetical protein